MRVVGIIAEYNPFHHGHAYQLRKAKETTGSDFLIVAMSGDFVQRGEPAIVDKYLRARAALLAGADLVLMLPVYASTASAERFARTGVATLASCGVVDTVSFGCEDVAIASDGYRHLAHELSHETKEFQNTLAGKLSEGLTYGNAKSETITELYGHAYDLSLIQKPNNLLGFEYERAIAHFGLTMQPAPIRRIGDYHDASHSSGFASASACRKFLLETDSKALCPNEQLKHALPEYVHDLLNTYIGSNHFDYLCGDDLSEILHYTLMTESPDTLAGYLDCGKDLASRIVNKLPEYESFSKFCELLKNKSISHSRVQRALLHILLKLPHAMAAPLVDSQGTVPYLRVLGFRKESGELLHQIKQHASVPMISRLPESDKLLSSSAQAYFMQDVQAAAIYRSLLLHKCGQTFSDDYHRRIEIV